MYKPEGVYVAMLTPFHDDGLINEDELRRIVDFQIEAGVDGLFPVSSVGEYIHMRREEKVRMTAIVMEQNAGRVCVTAGVGSSHPAESIALAKKAKELGCDGVVVAPPYYFPQSQENIEKYFETIADAVDIPNILYNIPLFTQPLSYDLVKRLSRRKNIVGMKDSSGSMVDFLHFMDKIKNISKAVLGSVAAGMAGAGNASAATVAEVEGRAGGGAHRGEDNRLVSDTNIRNGVRHQN